ncbi:tRNA (5-methylaminomethyl-2-thiouridylate)-methyltransferase [Hymenobacter humi]|uniref:tRNA (5-methylaminomethyl-2-thiouridylate)-methyltransferase n=1 Tax=Hymenobacter humi TaxID=1411620 RepID=A0ABW2U8L9_9BACT
MFPSANLPYSSSDARPAASAAHTVIRVLTITYGLVPIIAGLDKFANLLTNWEAYLAPAVVRMLPVSAHTFMLVVGVIEIIAGILVLVRPRIGAWVVMAWLLGIALNLVVSGRYFDVAVRDAVMAVGAWSLARLTAGAGTQA